MLCAILLFLLLGCNTIVKPRSQTVLPPKTLLFTFDDGPNEWWDVTSRLLDVLKKYRVRAFFSVIGTRAQASPELVRRIVREGHILVNHSMHHDPSIIGGKDQVAREFDDADRVFGKILGVTNYHSRFIRTPLGVITGNIDEFMKERHLFILPITYFNGDSEATVFTQDRVVDEMIREFGDKDGGMLVFHDGIPRFHPLGFLEYFDPTSPVNRIWVPDAVERAIECFSEMGYRFDLPDELMARVMTNGFLLND